MSHCHECLTCGGYWVHEDYNCETSKHAPCAECLAYRKGYKAALEAAAIKFDNVPGGYSEELRALPIPDGPEKR